MLSLKIGHVINVGWQRQKVYVQDLIREQAKRVYHALADCQGLFYVCGYVYKSIPSRRP